SRLNADQVLYVCTPDVGDLAVMPVCEVYIDLTLIFPASAVVLRVVLHECSGHSAEGAFLLPLLSLLRTNAAMGIGHDGLCLRASVGKAEQVIRWLESDPAIFAVDTDADEERLMPGSSNSNTEARKQLVPVVNRS